MAKQKTRASRIFLGPISIVFVALFLGILILSVSSFVVTHLSSKQVHPSEVTRFFIYLKHFKVLTDPVSIFIQLLTTIGGVFFGIRIGQWVDEKEEEKKLSEIWGRINEFLVKLKSGIHNQTSIYELAEYKVYWDSLQRADNTATRRLQGDIRYIDISFVFSFLSFYKSSWIMREGIGDWKDNAPTAEKTRIEKWTETFDDLITYTADKVSAWH